MLRNYLLTRPVSFQKLAQVKFVNLAAKLLRDRLVLRPEPRDLLMLPGTVMAVDGFLGTPKLLNLERK